MAPSTGARGPPSEGDAPERQALFDALEDPTCRRLVRHLTEPASARDLAEALDLPLSTTYRKLDRLVDAGLAEETVGLRDRRFHATRYRLRFETMRVCLDLEAGALDVSTTEVEAGG